MGTLPACFRSNSGGREGQTGAPKKKGANTPAESGRAAVDSGSLVSSREPVWTARCLQWLLVHVLADRRQVPEKGSPRKQGGLPRDRQCRTSARAHRL